jgi:hypothetical protein
LHTNSCEPRVTLKSRQGNRKVQFWADLESVRVSCQGDDKHRPYEKTCVVGANLVFARPRLSRSSRPATTNVDFAVALVFLVFKLPLGRAW